MRSAASDSGDFREGISAVGRATVRWRRIGRGPDLFFLPGFPLTADTWDGVAANLCDRFTCHAVDLIGLGQSYSDCEDDYSSRGQARVFQQLLTAWGVHSYALIGNDTGGWIARELALLDQPRITHLVLTNTEIPHHQPPWIPMYQTFALLPGFGRLLRRLLKSPSFCRSSLAFGGCFHDRSRIEGDFRRRYIQPLVDSAASTEQALLFLRHMRFQRLDEFGELHGQIHTPTLFVWGEDDPTFPVAQAREMARRFPRIAGFEVVPQARLFFYEEKPDLVAHRIRHFVTDRAALLHTMPQPTAGMPPEAEPSGLTARRGGDRD